MISDAYLYWSISEGGAQFRTAMPAMKATLKERDIWKIILYLREFVRATLVMKLGIVIYSNDPETVWNAFRLGVFSLKHDDAVSVFLLGKGVEAEALEDARFDVKGQMRSFVDAGGRILACGTCLKIRNAADSGICPVSTMQDLHAIICDSDRVLTF